MKAVEFVERDPHEPHWKTVTGKTVKVSKETHKRIKEIAEKSGMSMIDTSEQLMRFALEHVVWTEGGKK